MTSSVPGLPDDWPPQRFCGGCESLQFEDADGLGWCPFLRLEVRCDLPACVFYRSE